MFDWITGLIKSTGYLGVALLMFAENVFPPIPSELIMPLAGFNAARGEMSLVLVILSGTAGSLAGVTLWYWIGVRLGVDRLKRFSDEHGRWLTMTREDIDRAVGWFDRHGGWAVFVGRLVPTVRTLISVPAGVSSMSLTRFLLFSAAGTAAWTTLLTLAGYWLEGAYEEVQGYVGPVSDIVVGVIAVWYAYRVITFRQERAEDG